MPSDRRKSDTAKAVSPGVAARVPPGQSVTTKWPVLTYGETPRFDAFTREEEGSSGKECPAAGAGLAQTKQRHERRSNGRVAPHRKRRDRRSVGP